MNPRPTGSSPASVPPGAVVAAPHVLLVDDEAVVARSVAKLIERLGYRVTVAESGAAALEAAAAVKFDLVLTDQTMPGMSGAELIASLVSSRAIAADRIILTYRELRDTGEAIA